VDFSAAKVGIIPDTLMKRNPRGVLDELMPPTAPPPATMTSPASSRLPDSKEAFEPHQGEVATAARAPESL
jgi:hypothetical protein